jgi:hypothetical protein
LCIPGEGDGSIGFGKIEKCFSIERMLNPDALFALVLSAQKFEVRIFFFFSLIDFTDKVGEKLREKYCGPMKDHQSGEL